MYRYKMLFLVAFTMFLVIPIFASAVTTSPPSGTRDYSPRMACNSNNCLLTWIRDNGASTYAVYDVYYQLLDTQGNPIGNEAALITGIKAASNYVIAGSDSFFVTWIDQTNPDFIGSESYHGRLIDTKSGSPVAKPTMSFGVANVYEGKIIGAYDSVNNRYLIAYSSTTSTNSPHDISIRTVDASSGSILNSQTYLQSTDDSVSSIVYDPTNRHYILAYYSYTGDAPFSNWNLKMTAVDMFGNRVLKAGTQTPVEITIAGANWGGTGVIDTHLLRNSANQYILVFPKISTSPLYSQLVTPVISAGKINDLTVNSVTEYVTAEYDQYLVAAAYNSNDNTIMVVWYRSNPAGVYSIILASNGFKISAEKPIQLNINSSFWAKPLNSLFFNPTTSKFILPIAVQNKVSTALLSATGSVATSSKFIAPISNSAKRFVPKDAQTGAVVADGSQNTNNIAINFVNESLGLKLVVNALFANGDVDLSAAKIEANDTATAVDLTGTVNVDSTHQIFVPNANSGQGVRVCPTAKTLAQIAPGCANELLLKTIPSTQNGISVAFTQFKTAQDTYSVSGLTGSGAGLYFAPGTSPSPTPTPSPSTESQANLTVEQTKNNNTIDFIASYTSNSTGSPTVIPNPSCIIEFGDIAGAFNMTYSPVFGGGAINKYSRIFTSTASAPYKVTCSKSGFTTEVFNKTFSIQVAGVDNPPNVQAVSPIDNKIFSNTADVEFICSAEDDHALNAIKLLTDIPSKKESVNTVTGTSNATSWTINAIPKGTYTWSCQAEDGSGQKKETAKRTLTINFTSTGSACSEDWSCTPSSFSSIPCPTDGTKRRVCTDRNNCSNTVPSVPKPDTERCIPVGGAACQEDWDCRGVGSCVEGKQSLACTDKNNCSNTVPSVEKPKSKSCGATTSGGDGFPIWIIGVIAAVVVVLVLLIIIKKRRGGSRVGDEEAEDDYQSEKYSDDGELRPGYQGEEGDQGYDENQDDQGEGGNQGDEEER